MNFFSNEKYAIDILWNFCEQKQKNVFFHSRFKSQTNKMKKKVILFIHLLSKKVCSFVLFTRVLPM